MPVLLQPARLAALVAAVAIGTAAGVGGYTFLYADGLSYLSNDPNACANCHVMEEQLTGWLRSSHRNAASCNDCHLGEGLLGKLTTKASNGFWHSLAFTTGDFPDPIRIKPHNREISERACRKCHGPIVEAMESGHPRREATSCIRCHGSVGHPSLATPSAVPAR